jgi:hypothetical protein
MNILGFKTFSVLAISWTFFACNSANFSSKSGQNGKKAAPSRQAGEDISGNSVENSGQAVNGIDSQEGDGSGKALENDADALSAGAPQDDSSTDAAGVRATEFNIAQVLASAVNQSYVWVVTKSSKIVTRIELDKANNYPITQWTLPGPNSGHRTFVTEVGLIIGKNKGAIYRASDDNPGVAQLVVDLGLPDFTHQAGDTRTCVTSFKINGTPYISAVYTGEGGRIFSRFPIDSSQPAKVNVAGGEFFPQGSASWGYSCAIDHGRKTIWSARNGGEVYGVNFETGMAVANAQLPNTQHIANNEVPGYSLSTVDRESYAIASDPSGNLLNAENIYTFAFENSGKLVYGSGKGSSTMGISDARCFYEKTDCALNVDIHIFPLNDVGSIGPMSSLHDGRVAGIVRGDGKRPSEVYLISPKDPQNIRLGLELEKIKEIPGDAYMYTDFTGASLYAQNQTLLFDLNQAESFQKTLEIQNMDLTWQAASNTAEPWEGLTMQIRCYQSGQNPLPPFTDVQNIPNAGTPFSISDIATCKGLVDQVEIFVGPDAGNGVFTKTAMISLAGTQR